MKLQNLIKRYGGWVIVLGLAVALSLWVILNPGGNVQIENQSELRTELPQDFDLSYEWGACSTEAARQILSINPSGQLYLLSVDSSGTTGRESNRVLSKREINELLAVLRTNRVFELPEEILPDEGKTTLTPGCSHLEVAFDGQATTIDEADGLNNEYYRIKLILSNLAAGVARDAAL